MTWLPPKKRRRKYTAAEVKEWRKRLGGENAITQKQLAAELGIGNQTLSLALQAEAYGELA